MKLSKYVKLGSLALFSTVAVGCSLPGLESSGAEDDTITVAGQVSTEAVILTHLVEGLIEHYVDQDVQTIQNLGASTMVTQAMNQDDANVAAVQYTGTSLTGGVRVRPNNRPEESFRSCCGRI